MTTHKLKIEHDWFERLRSGQKTCEVRRHDRDYQVGDRVRFSCNLDQCTAGWTWQITHILTDDTFVGLADGYCVLSLADRQHKPGEDGHA